MEKDNVVELPVKSCKLEIPVPEATAAWKSLKFCLDNKVPHFSEAPLLFRSMEYLAKAIDEANKGE